MNADILNGKWLQLKGTVKETWGRLTDDDMDRVSGDVDKLIGVIQERYGYQKQRAQQEVNDFVSRHKFEVTR